jgi:hypothetical protein
MAKPTPEVLNALTRTIERLQTTERYQWSHMGACNCGFLAQSLTQLSPAQIHAYALQKKGDWDEHVQDFCPTSGYPIDLIIDQMVQAGFTPEDLRCLERLSHPAVLATMPAERRQALDYRKREDVIYYLECWRDLLAPAVPLTSEADVPFGNQPYNRQVLTVGAHAV